jgi:hypothetical protein
MGREGRWIEKLGMEKTYSLGGCQCWFYFAVWRRSTRCAVSVAAIAVAV